MTPKVLVVAQRRNGLKIPTGAACSRFKPYLWQQRTLVLPQLGFDPTSVGSGLANARIGRDRLIDGVEDRESGTTGSGYTRSPHENCTQRKRRNSYTHSRLPRPHALSLSLDKTLTVAFRTNKQTKPDLPYIWTK